MRAIGCTSRVEDVTPAHILIAMPSDGTSTHELPVGSQVEIQWIAKRGLGRVSGTVAGREIVSVPCLRIDLREPQGGADHETVQVSDYVRAGVNAPLDFQQPDNLALDGNGNLYITEDGPDGAGPVLRQAQAAGKVRLIGLTSHQRAFAAGIAAQGGLELLMIRYNAAHRGAETDVFPTTDELALPVVVYTCLRWGALLEGTPDDPAGFRPPRAPACSRTKSTIWSSSST